MPVSQEAPQSTPKGGRISAVWSYVLGGAVGLCTGGAGGVVLGWYIFRRFLLEDRSGSGGKGGPIDAIFALVFVGAGLVICGITGAGLGVVTTLFIRKRAERKWLSLSPDEAARKRRSSRRRAIIALVVLAAIVLLIFLALVSVIQVGTVD